MCYQWDIGDKKKKENAMVEKIMYFFMKEIIWVNRAVFCWFVLCWLGTRWDHLWEFIAIDWPVGKSWLIWTWEGSSHSWRWHPLEDDYSSYKKAIGVNHGKQVSKNHSSIASTSVSVSRFLLWVPFLVSFNCWLKQVRYNKPFLCSSCLWSVAFLSYRRNRNQSTSVLFNQILKYPENF